MKSKKRLIENIGGYEWLKEALIDYKRGLSGEFEFGMTIIKRFEAINRELKAIKLVSALLERDRINKPTPQSKRRRG